MNWGSYLEGAKLGLGRGAWHQSGDAEQLHCASLVFSLFIVFIIIIVFCFNFNYLTVHISTYKFYFDFPPWVGGKKGGAK